MTDSTSIATRVEALLARPAVWRNAIAVVVAMQTALILTHRGWVDEWQALLIASQSPTLADLLANLRYEGHPALWYLLLRGVGAVVPLDWVLAATTLPIALATQWLVLTRAPFVRWQRLALACGALLMFGWMTVARGMTLGVAVAFHAVAFRRLRWSWLALAVLPQCDFLFGIVSVVLVVRIAFERRLCWPGVALWLASSALAAWTVLPAPDIQLAVAPFAGIDGTLLWLMRCGNLLIPLTVAGSQLQWNALLPLPATIPAALTFFVLAHLLLKNRWLDQTLFFAVVALTFAINVAIYPLQPHNLSILALILILLVWIRAADGDVPHPWFAPWLGVGALAGLIVAGVALVQPFNTSYQVATFMHAHRLEHRRWVVFPDSRAVIVSGLTGVDFEWIEKDCAQSFVRWNARSIYRSSKAFAETLRSDVRDHGGGYLLTDFVPDPLPRDVVRPVMQTGQGFDGARFFVWRLGPGASLRDDRRRKACAPLRRSPSR